MPAFRTRSRNQKKREKWKNASRARRIRREAEYLNTRKELEPEAAWEWLLRDTERRIHFLKMSHAWDNVAIANLVFGRQSASELEARITNTYESQMKAKSALC